MRPVDLESIDWQSMYRDLFEKLFDESPVPYFILDKKGSIKNINKAGLRFFGLTSEEIIMKNFFSFAPDDEADNAGFLLSSCISNSPIDKKELRIVGKGGEIRCVLVSIMKNSSLDNDPSSLVTIFDITEQKNLDQSKTEFVSLASHQLRTPLVTIKWNTEMLLHPETGQLNPKQDKYIRTIGEVNKDMVDLVDTLLNISRIEIGKLPINNEATNVQEVTDGILLEVAPQIEKKNMTVIKQYDGLLTNITSDPKLLRIIIHNLITNALKYTPDGGTVTIRFNADAERNQITVTDTGYGIPASQQSKIFSKQFRADNVKEISSSQSTGLGLYMVKSLVTSMGGNISFQSEENKGTSFTVTI
jgi:PAS domain S-box-containing protein